MSQVILSDQPRIFPCPNCGEMIYNNAATCRFCSVPIDPQAAETAANLQTRINNACNHAKVIRNVAGAMWFFFAFVRFIPFIGIFGLVAVFPCFVIVPVGLVYWQIKYGRIQTADIDYKKAKRNWIVALVLWLLMAIFLPLALWALFWM
jgi:hypothetical protein